MSHGHYDFRGQILGCPTESIGLVYDLLGEAEISDLEMSILRNQKVLWLEVSITNALLMEVVESQNDLCCVKESNIVGKALFFS